MSIIHAESSEEKAACYDLRHKVFVEEQGVPVDLEIDEYDETIASHFLGLIKGKPVAAARICVFGDMACEPGSSWVSQILVCLGVFPFCCV